MTQSWGWNSGLCVCPADTIAEPHARSRLILSENLTLYTCLNPALGRLSREDPQCEVSQLRSKVRPSLSLKKKKKQKKPKTSQLFLQFLVSKYEGHLSQVPCDNAHFTAYPVCPRLHPPNCPRINLKCPPGQRAVGQVGASLWVVC